MICLSASYPHFKFGLKTKKKHSFGHLLNIIRLISFLKDIKRFHLSEGKDKVRWLMGVSPHFGLLKCLPVTILGVEKRYLQANFGIKHA